MNTMNLIRLRAFGTNLLIGFPGPLLAEETGFQMDSIGFSPAGVTLEWNDPATGRAYTPQKRSSLAAGDWVGLPTRYSWPSVSRRWTDFGVPAEGAGFYRVVAEPIPAPRRGKNGWTPTVRRGECPGPARLVVLPAETHRKMTPLSELHRRILDAFNEHAVQVMSPHFVAQPEQAAVVPEENWHQPPPEQAGEGSPDQG
jgi:hypothetical protein